MPKCSVCGFEAPRIVDLAAHHRDASSTTATAQDVFLTTASGDTLSTWHTTGDPGTAAWSEQHAKLRKSKRRKAAPPPESDVDAEVQLVADLIGCVSASVENVSPAAIDRALAFVGARFGAAK